MELHKPVLLNEVIEGLAVKNALLNRRLDFIDATVGLGGHTAEIVKLGGHVLGIEADNKSLEQAGEKLKMSCPTPEDKSLRGSFTLVHGNFRDIDSIARKNDFWSVAGILLDLGISSYQLEDMARGLSFKDVSAPLDMRVDPISQKITAAILLNVLSQSQLLGLFQVTEKREVAKKLTDKIVAARGVKKFEKVGDLLSLIGDNRPFKKGIHPGTLPFLALRIAVNSELDNLRDCLPKAFSLLDKGGRLVVISFHSGEDKIVKDYFESEHRLGTATVLTHKPILPSAEEINENPRSRSAKLRILQKT